MRKNRLYLLLPIRSLMFIAVFIIISLMSGEKLENLFHYSFIPLLLDGRYIMYRFLSFLPLTLWI